MRATEGYGKARQKPESGVYGLWSSLRTLSVAFLCLPVLSVASFAEQGGRPGGVFDFGASARALGLGGAYTAAVQDASALYYNPAGFGLLPNRQLALMHARLYGDATFDYLGYGQTFHRWNGGWGLELLQEGIGGVEGRDALNRPSGSASFAQTGFGLGAGWHGVLLSKLSLGLGFKGLDRKLAGSADRLFGVDLGAQYGPIMGRRLSMGMVVQNVGAFSTGDTSDRLPLKGSLGLFYRLVGGLSLAADMNDKGKYRVGTEYVLGMFALRGGYALQGISMGGGVTLFKSFQLDMAVFSHPSLGASERVSLLYRFGVGRPPRQETFARDHLAEAKKRLEAREYPEASQSLEKALALYPGLDPVWGEKAARLKSFSEELRLASRPELREALKRIGEQPDTAAQAVSAYLEGQNAKAMLLAHAAIGADPSQAAFEDVLKTMGRLTGLSVRPEDKLAPAALVQEKLKRAKAFFYETRFDMALRECQEVLLLDPMNQVAWVRMGSCHFALGDVEKARGAYRKALELDPTDETVKDFMRMQGWK